MTPSFFCPFAHYVITSESNRIEILSNQIEFGINRNRPPLLCGDAFGYYMQGLCRSDCQERGRVLTNL